MSIKHPNVPREDYDNLALKEGRLREILEVEKAKLQTEVSYYKMKKEAAERLFWMLNDNRKRDISFWKQGCIATSIGMVVLVINTVLFC